MKTILRSCTALTLCCSFAGQAAAQAMMTEIGPGEGQVDIVRMAGLYRARRDRCRL